MVRKAGPMLLFLVIVLAIISACARPAPSAPSPTEAKPPSQAAPASATPITEAPLTEAPKAPAKTQPPVDAFAELYQAAKAEGEVIWQIGTPFELMKPVADGFEARFPGVKVKIVQASAPVMVARLVTESGAGKVSVDVAFGTIAWVKPLLDRDLLVKGGWESINGVDKSAIFMDGRFATVYGFANVIIYNTNLVKAADVPKTWEDLLHPRWKGQIAVPLTTIGASVLFKAWGQERATKYLEQLREQRLVVDRGADAVSQRVANGEVALGDTIMSIIPAMKASGMPIDATPISPQRESPFGVYYIKGAPHPSAAKLFIAWMETAEGQAAWKATGRGPSVPCNASDAAKLFCDKGVKLEIADTLEKAMAQEEMIEQARDILGLKPPQ